MSDGWRVAFQGVAGAFSEQALLGAVGKPVAPVGLETAADVGRAIVAGEVRCGFLPLENSLAGTVTPSYDVLVAHRLSVVGEVVMPIHHCLMAPPGAALDGIREVLSHPVALAQCKRFFAEHPALSATAAFDTAGAAAGVAAAGDLSRAAIAPIGCAQRYGLELLATSIEDRDDNQTRFVFLVRPEAVASFDLLDGPPRRAMFHAVVPHERGALARLLTVFAEQEHNLTKLEGRPATDPWTYHFFIEVDPPEGGARVAPVLRACEGLGEVRVLGVFPRVTIEG